MSTARLYYEAHVTVDSKPNEYWNEFTNILPSYFRHSKFDEDNVDNYHGKWFMSARSPDLEGIKNIIRNSISVLESLNYNVIRWKIEDTVLDSKYGDSL